MSVSTTAAKQRFGDLEPPLGLVTVPHTLEKPRVLAFSGPAALPTEDQWEAWLSAVMSQSWTPDMLTAG